MIGTPNRNASAHDDRQLHVADDDERQDLAEDQLDARDRRHLQLLERAELALADDPAAVN